MYDTLKYKYQVIQKVNIDQLEVIPEDVIRKKMVDNLAEVINKKLELVNVTEEIKNRKMLGDRNSYEESQLYNSDMNMFVNTIKASVYIFSKEELQTFINEIRDEVYREIHSI